MNPQKLGQRLKCLWHQDSPVSGLSELPGDVVIQGRHQGEGFSWSVSGCNAAADWLLTPSVIFSASVGPLSCKRTSVPLNLQLDTNRGVGQDQQPDEDSNTHKALPLGSIPWLPPARGAPSAARCSVLPPRWTRPSRTLCGSPSLYPGATWRTESNTHVLSWSITVIRTGRPLTNGRRHFFTEPNCPK